MKKRVRKAVFPAAGFGTRFLPATKAIPKEMLPLVDKPILQYGVEEALAAGCEQIIFITSHGKSVMEDHFDSNFELEASLEKRGKKELLEVVRRVSNMANISYVRQKEPLGLGHAVLMAREVVGDEPFAVILPDDVVDARTPCIGQMIEQYDQRQSSIIATQVVDGPAISAYGVIDGTPLEDNPRMMQVKGMVEKPKLEDAPSNHAIIGRYILTPAIFDLIEKTPAGVGGELQLTDGIRALLASEKVYSYEFEGKRYDAGDKLGMLTAMVDFTLKREDLGPGLRKHIQSLKL